ncbi:uncharacterized protein RHTO_07526 [Rhodotorula toruloides NP11]|uniref:Uncharacterized protein n=1 Tax=Rhodotorula toruloides (strain NP11) TaxID=1130832 RepID=M7XH32_RHOT1|nr:uncharacterized protein RHTO_07526 [Rhodotorula toruloides NP11]EMS23184.1 hypothetical protein RHTO_07526 [Rhodotorula toruloides NP11]
MATITVTAPPDDSEHPRSSLTSTSSTSPSPSSVSPLHLAAPPLATTRGRDRSASNATQPETTILNPDHPPPLNFHFGWKGPVLYLVFLLVCNVLIPCLLYYLLRIYTRLDDKELIGIGSAALGVSSCFDAPRTVLRHRAKYGPLYYPYMADPAFEPAGKNRLMRNIPRSWWHLDFTMHTYTLALFTFAIPLAIAPAIPLYNFFLLSFPMLVAPIMIVFGLTLKSWKGLRWWMSSDPPRTPTKPAVYYILEDVGAVDFRLGREWRKRCQTRYAASPPFRTLMWWQTLYWTFGMAVFIGATAAVDWTTDLQLGFGLCISLLFIWALPWSLLSYLLIHRSLLSEREWWRTHFEEVVCRSLVRQEGEGGGEKAVGVGVESEGERRGGRTRGYSVHARLEAGPAAMAGEMREVEGATESRLVGRAQAEEKREVGGGRAVENV